MTIQQLIQAIPSWQTLTPVQLHTVLEEKNVQYLDLKMYRLTEIAKFIGGDNMPAFLTLVKQAGYEWMITEAASGVQLGDPSINTRLRALNHPVAIALANHTNRMISVLEQNNITTTPEEVGEAQAKLLLEIYKQTKTDYAQDYTQAYREAMNVWDGNPETEPEF
jgi:hypothetical protein